MNLEQVKNYYYDIIKTHGISASKLKKQIFQISMIRLLIVVACIICCYFVWHNKIAVLVSIVVAIILFLIFLKIHNNRYIKKKYHDIHVKNAQSELKALDDDYSDFDGTYDKQPEDHNFSFDLDIFGNNSLFQVMNRTVTFLGKERLAKYLLSPLQNEAEISDRQNAIRELCKCNDFRQHFKAIGQLNETEDINLNHFSEGFNLKNFFTQSGWRIFPILSPILFVILCVLSATHTIPASIITLYWVVFIFLSAATLKKIHNSISGLEKKSKILTIYFGLMESIENQKFESSLLNQLQTKLNNNKASVQIKQLKKLCDNLDLSFTLVGFVILNPLLFWNIIFMVKTEKWLNKYKSEIKGWLSVLADFEALVSLATFAYNHPDYNYPQISESPVFEAKDLGHPMIPRQRCVKNDVDMNKHPFFLVITGANMAGKSTYLRTIGINHVLACMGCPVCAESMITHPFSLITNLRTSDSLNDNESYFFAELKRLKLIIDKLKQGEKLFIILDEILKGTNSEDKQKGSLALIKQLISLEGSGIIATHDLVLGILEDEYPENIKNYRFEAEIKENNLYFSYKIREGIAKNMNACFLMKKMGITGL